MKRSLLIIMSLLLACIMALTSCNTAHPEPLPTNDSVDTSIAEENEFLADADVEAEAELELEVVADSESSADSSSASAPEAVPEEGETPAGEATLGTKDEAITEAGAKLKDNIPAAKSYAGVMHYTTTAGKSKTCNIDFTLDYKNLIDGSNTTYSKELSKLSILYASDVYKNLYIKLNKGASGGNDTATTFGKLLGLQNTACYKISAANYAVDKDDITEFFVGHKKMIYNGIEREVIIVSVRGTNETNAEWSSNFDVGADTKEYYSIMGSSHPDWKNKSNHKGFDVAANRVYDKLTSYIKSYVDSDAQTSILLTGHSRGAAIANILGQMFTDKTSYKTYAYTFAAPNTTTAKNASSYKNIFNVKNKDDIIPSLPLSEWGFTNYGVTKSISVKSAYGYEPGLFGKEKTGAFKWFIGESYNDDGGTQRTLDCFAALATCREDLYKLDTTSHGKFSYTGVLGLKYNQKDATAKYNEIKTKLQNEKLLKFCNIYVVKSGSKYYVEVNYCPAFFMQMLSNMTTGVGDLLGYTLGTKYNDAKLSFIASSGKVVVGGMEHPHMQPTYYLIARNNFQTLDQLNK